MLKVQSTVKDINEARQADSEEQRVTKEDIDWWSQKCYAQHCWHYRQSAISLFKKQNALIFKLNKQ